jgi:hypothetical protein
MGCGPGVGTSGTCGCGAFGDGGSFGVGNGRGTWGSGVGCVGGFGWLARYVGMSTAAAVGMPDVRVRARESSCARSGLERSRSQRGIRRMRPRPDSATYTSLGPTADEHAPTALTNDVASRHPRGRRRARTRHLRSRLARRRHRARRCARTWIPHRLRDAPPAPLGIFGRCSARVDRDARDAAAVTRKKRRC